MLKTWLQKLDKILIKNNQVHFFDYTIIFRSTKMLRRLQIYVFVLLCPCALKSSALASAPCAKFVNSITSNNW